jgi:hypothetical protein
MLTRITNEFYKIPLSSTASVVGILGVLISLFSTSTPIFPYSETKIAKYIVIILGSSVAVMLAKTIVMVWRKNWGVAFTLMLASVIILGVVVSDILRNFGFPAMAMLMGVKESVPNGKISFLAYLLPAIFFIGFLCSSTDLDNQDSTEVAPALTGMVFGVIAFVPLYLWAACIE